MEPIENYAIIGDCRSAALVSKSGAIDWLCWPRFDSGPVFGALLDPDGGSWQIAPDAPYRVERRYRPDTNVLETRFTTDGGACVLTDFMPVMSESDQRRRLVPEHELVRLLSCERGEVELGVRFAPRAGFAGDRLRPRAAKSYGYRFDLAGALLLLRSEVELAADADGALAARVRLGAGQTRSWSLSLAESWPAIVPPLGASAAEAAERSAAWWRSWSARLRYDGVLPEAVRRSALVLKLLAYAPSGAVIAAPTTSLPERIGGDLNWDYRYCWLRDAALTVRALFGLGYAEEAEAFLSWLLHSTRLTQPRLRILYDLYGNDPPPERRLPDWAGYAESRPVRVGNAAADQLQLDVYGEVIEAAAEYVRRGGSFDRETRRLLARFGDYVCRHWMQPDEGIWEPRSGKAHNTHSRVMCWTALNRLLEIGRGHELPGADMDRFAREQQRIAVEIRERAFNQRLGSYVSRLDGDELDASLFSLVWSGFEDARSERMQRTYRLIQERLGAGNGLLYRYRNDDSPGEGAFGICSFWGAEFLAAGGGSLAEATTVFETLARHANDVGLFAEEIDPVTFAALGNFPQAFTHVGLINAALTLAERTRRELAPVEEASA